MSKGNPELRYQGEKVLDLSRIFEDETVSNTINQATGMTIASGRIEENTESFKECHEASKAFIVMLEC